MSPRSLFCEALCEKMISSMTTLHGTENWDEEVLGNRKITWKQMLKEKAAYLINRIISKKGLSICAAGVTETKYRTIINNYGAGLDALFDMLSDDHSKNTLVEVIAFRILGYRYVRLSCNNEHYWRLRKKASALVHDGRGFTPPLPGKATSFYDLRDLDLPLTVYGYPPSITHTFLCKHSIHMTTAVDLWALAMVIA